MTKTSTIVKYVIGLDDDNRFDTFFTAPGAAGFERFSVSDGRDGKLGPDDMDYERFNQRWGRDPRGAEIGCMLSHVRVMRAFLETDAEWAVVAEDDALVSADVDKVVESLIAKLGDNAMVNMGDYSGVKAGRINPSLVSFRLSLLARPVRGIYRVGYTAQRMGGTGLYLLSRKAARTILAEFESAGKVHTVADDYPLYSSLGVDVRQLHPGLCGWEGSSTIEPTGYTATSDLMSRQQGKNALDRLRIFLAPKNRLANARNTLESTVADVKRRFSR